VDAAALLAHLGNVGSVLGETTKVFEIKSLNCHGPKAEIAKLKDALTPMGCVFWETL
jgi:hypothetical protein